LTLGFFASAQIRSKLVLLHIWLIKTFLEKVISTSGSADDISSLTWSLAGAGSLIFLAWMGKSVADYFAAILQAGRRVEITLRQRLIDHLLRLSLGFFNHHSRADIMRATHSDSTSLRMLVHTTCGLVISASQALDILWLALIIDSKLAIWGLAALPVFIFPAIRAGRIILGEAKTTRFEGVSIGNLLLQILSGIRIIKVFQGETREAKACINSAGELLRATVAIVRRRSVARVILDSLGGIGIFVVIMVAGPKIASGELEWPVFVMFVFLLNSLFGTMRQILLGYTAIKTQSVGIDRIDEFFETEPEITDAADAVELKAPPREIRFEDVTYSYDTEPVLKAVNLTVKAGETIGIVGASGVGKTTLLNLAARFYDPEEGRIAYDSMDIRNIKLKDLMKSLAIVTQEPFLFQVSIMENIRYGRPDAKDEEVFDAAKAAGIHDDIVTWAKGYDTIIGPKGTDVSVGQKQRINIARAILKNAPILLLDEATSALDSVTESQVQEALEQLMEKCTTLVVAHRLSTLRKADKIAVLANGSVEAFAPHDELLKTSPTYQSLWTAQQHSGDKGSSA